MRSASAVSVVAFSTLQVTCEQKAAYRRMVVRLEALIANSSVKARSAATMLLFVSAARVCSFAKSGVVSVSSAQNAACVLAARCTCRRASMLHFSNVTRFMALMEPLVASSAARRAWNTRYARSSGGDRFSACSRCENCMCRLPRYVA